MGIVPNVNSLKCGGAIGRRTILVMIKCHLGADNSDSIDLAYWIWGSNFSDLTRMIIDQFWFCSTFSLRGNLTRLERSIDEKRSFERTISCLEKGAFFGVTTFCAEVHNYRQVSELFKHKIPKINGKAFASLLALDCEGDPSIDVRDFNYHRFDKMGVTEKRFLDVRPKWEKWFDGDECNSGDSIPENSGFHVGIRKDPSLQKNFDSFCQFAEFLNFDMTGVDLRGFRFQDSDVDTDCFKRCDFSNALIDKDAFSNCAFADFSFFENHREFMKKVPPPPAEERKYPVLKKDFSIQSINEDRAEGFGGVFYISDLHLDYKIAADFSGKTSRQQIQDYVSKIAEKITRSVDSKSLLLIGGDTTFDPDLFELFFRELHCHVLTVLGNHELWSFENRGIYGKTYDEIVGRLRSTRAVVENDLVVFRYADLSFPARYSQSEILKLSNKELMEKGRNGALIVLGGIGFSGLNEQFNANSGIYRDTIKREEEIERSEAFEKLYRRVNSALGNKTVIVLTHMPMRDWTSDKPNPKWIYISGHTHQNFAQKDETGMFLADHQVGYRGRNYCPGYFPFKLETDYFAGYRDGKYAISGDDYLTFYRCYGFFLNIKEERFDITMLKRDGFYLFLGKKKNATDHCFFVLNGGRSNKAKKNLSLEYFFENMAIYGQSIKAFTKKYFDFQKRVAVAVKAFGGDGKIHGAIVDIDYYCHVYVNPLDSTLTPYFAENMVNKAVYPDICTLLFAKEKPLYHHFIRQNEIGSTFLLGKPHEVTKAVNPKIVFDTSMYRASRILKSLQYASGFGVIRVWNEPLLNAAKKDLISQERLGLEFIREKIEGK